MGRMLSLRKRVLTMQNQGKCRPVLRGVSLVELIVVLTILAVLLALLLPAVQSARERAREAVCKNNLYQLNLALTHYSETHKKIPAAPRDGWVSGWCWEVLPYIEQQNLYNGTQIPLTIAAAPLPLRSSPRLFRCPRRTSLQPIGDQEWWPSHYVLSSNSRREYFNLWDAPLDVRVSWANSPEQPRAAMGRSKGPHHNGFFLTHGAQQGVEFMIDGVSVR